MKIPFEVVVFDHDEYKKDENHEWHWGTTTATIRKRKREAGRTDNE